MHRNIKSNVLWQILVLTLKGLLFLEIFEIEIPEKVDDLLLSQC